jgi:N-acetylated-alpha-linked acidic dipeptidase
VRDPRPSDPSRASEPARSGEPVCGLARAGAATLTLIAALGVPATGHIANAAPAGQTSAAPAAPQTQTAAAPGAVEAEIPRGFRPERGAAQRDLEARLRARISRQRIEQDLERLTVKPHFAGSPADRDTADYVASELRRAGLNAEIVEYVHYLSTPKHLEAEIIVPDSVPLTLTEDVIPSDSFTRDAAQYPGWNAYSASGSASAQVVYAGHGSREDFATLERLGVELREKSSSCATSTPARGRKWSAPSAPGRRR